MLGEVLGVNRNQRGLQWQGRFECKTGIHQPRCEIGAKTTRFLHGWLEHVAHATQNQAFADEFRARLGLADLVGDHFKGIALQFRTQRARNRGQIGC